MPKSHLYLALTHSFNNFRFRGRHGSSYGEFMQNYKELHAGRYSIEFGVRGNLYFDAKIAFLSLTCA